MQSRWLSSNPPSLRAALALAVCACALQAAVAQDVTKANNTTVLVDGASWVGGVVPTSSNVAVWNSTVTGTNTSDLGGNLSIAGIKITNPGGPVGISSGTVNSGAVTASSTADTFTYTGTDVVNGNIVSFGGTMPGGITSGRLYFIVNADTTAKTYQVSETAGGSAINLTSTGSSVTNTARYALTIGSSGIDLSSATQSLSTLSAPVSLSASQTWTTGSNRAIDINGNANNSGVPILNNGFNLIVNTVGNSSIDLGNVSGGGGITKNGNGTLNLYSAASSYSGDVVINAGTVNAGSDAGSLGTGSLTMTGGTLTAIANAARSFNRNTTIAGNAGFYNNNSTRTGATAYTFGTLSIGSHIYSVTANGSGTGSLAYGATTLTGSPTFDVGSRDINFLILGAVGESGGARGFTKSGIGTLTITGSSTYTGTTTIAGGSLKLDTNGSFANSPRIVVGNAGSSGAILDLTAKTGTFAFGAGQTVGGIGMITIGDGKTVQSQGTWAPGNSIGSNAVTGNLTLSGTSQFELGTPGTSTSSPGTSDCTAVSGTLTLGGALALLDNAGADGNGAAAGGVYRLFTYGSAVSGSYASVTANPTPTTRTSLSQITYGGSGTAAGQGVFLSVYNLASATSAQIVNVGNVHVGDTATKAVTLTNTAPVNATYTETLGSGGFSSTSAGFTATGSVTGVAGGSSGTGTLLVGFTTGSAGARSGSTVLSLNSEAVNSSGLGTTGAGTQSITITGTVWNYAAATIASGTTINFGTVLKGTSLAQMLSITNSSPPDGYSEKLDAAFGALTGDATSNAGSIALLAAGGTNASSMTVGLGSLTAGGKSGSAQVTFTSNGAGTSGLGTTSLTPQTVSMVGTVLDPAKASFLSGTAATTSLLLDFGSVNANASVSPLGFDLWNLMQTNGYTADLALVSIASGTGNAGAITTTLTGTFSNLTAGSFNSYTASLATDTAGSFVNVYTLSFKSANGGNVFGGDATQTLTLTVQGVIVVPEPGALALAGIGIAVAGWTWRKRRRTIGRLSSLTPST